MRIKINYNPSLSVEENAKICGVSVSAIRKFIRKSDIDRQYDASVARIQTIKREIQKKPDISIRQIAKNLSYSPNTVKKYLPFAMGSFINGSIINTKKVSSFDFSSSKRIIKSVSNNQTEILVNILRLYVPKKVFDCDLTASILGFYKSGIPLPKHLYDKFPQLPNVKPLDEIEMLPNDTFDSIIADLPFICSGKDNYINEPETNIIHKRFNSFKNREDLFSANDYIINQAFRLLKKNGVLCMKTMDTVSGGRQIWTSHYIISKCVQKGFELVDTFILIAKSKPLSGKIKTQIHARKYHSYFLVFQKM